MEEKNYLVSGMQCAGCAAKVERAVEGLEGGGARRAEFADGADDRSV